MNPKMDPNNVGKSDPNQTPMVIQPERIEKERPKNLPEFLNGLVAPDTIRGDLCRYFIFPAIEAGLHKTFSALLGYFVLGQAIRPSNAKSNGVYIYADNNKPVDYTSYSSGKTQATIIDSNGVSYNYSSSAKYTSGTMSIFKIQHFADDDVLHVNPLQWSYGDVEAKHEHLNDVLGDAIIESGWASGQDVSDAAGIAGAPPTANKWGWKDISRMSVFIDPDDPTTMIINMGCKPQPIT